MVLVQIVYLYFPAVETTSAPLFVEKKSTTCLEEMSSIFLSVRQSSPDLLRFFCSARGITLAQ
jgi:hypothetical protein